MNMRGKSFKIFSVIAHIVVLAILITYSKNQAEEKPVDISETHFSEVAPASSSSSTASASASQSNKEKNHVKKSNPVQSKQPEESSVATAQSIQQPQVQEQDEPQVLAEKKSQLLAKIKSIKEQREQQEREQAKRLKIQKEMAKLQALETVTDQLAAIEKVKAEQNMKIQELKAKRQNAEVQLKLKQNLKQQELELERQRMQIAEQSQALHLVKKRNQLQEANSEMEKREILLAGFGRGATSSGIKSLQAEIQGLEGQVASRQKNLSRAVAKSTHGRGQGSGGSWRSQLPSSAQSFASLRQMAGNPKPVYPEVARRNKWEGQGVILYYVTENGYVDKLKLIKSSGYNALDTEAIKAFERYRFLPGQGGWTYHQFVYKIKN